MIERFEDLDQAVDWILSKTSNNIIGHEWGSKMTQAEHDAHADALSHHASAIMHYRAKPEVQKALASLADFGKHRAYIKKPIKLTNKKAPQISVEDLDLSHPAMQSRTDHEAIVKALNGRIAAMHKEFHGNKDLQALHSHSDRFLAHLSNLVDLHNRQEGGKIPHSQIAAHVHAPEFTDRSARITDSKYRKHFHAGNGKYTTQSITKGTASGFDPGLPEVSALEEEHGHGSVGKPKELYPFHEVKVNGEPLKVKALEGDPDEIHDRDAHVNLQSTRKVRNAQGKEDRALGTHQGNPSAMKIVAGMERLGHIKDEGGGEQPEEEKPVKKSEEVVSEHFPDVTVAYYVLAKNLIEVLNPYAGMTDEEFADYVEGCRDRTLGPAEQAAIVVEAQNRFEKAAEREDMLAAVEDPSLLKAGQRNAKQDYEQGERFVNSRKIPERVHAQGVSDVLSGKVTPLPLPDEEEGVASRTKKEGEKRDEVGDMEKFLGTVKRSPYAVPKHVFTDDSYSKIDPEKFKQWVHGPMTEDDVRQQIAAYQHAIRHNPAAQQAHQKYIDLHRQNVREGLGRAADPEDGAAPRVEHDKAAQQAGEARAAGKMSLKEMAAQIASSGSKASKASTRKAKEEELTPEEQKVREADPDYKPTRLGVGRQAAANSEKDLTDIAHGKIPGHMLADSRDFGELDDQYGDAQTKEMLGAKGDEGEGVVGGSKTADPSPIGLVNEHPGFKAYLKMKEHLLSHYKNPAVRQYMEQKLLEHENNPNLDVDKLAATHHFLHRSRKQAEKASGGLDKLAGDLGKVPQGDEGEDGEAGKGSALAPESMLTPDQRAKLGEAREAKAKEPAAAPAAAAPSEREQGLRGKDDPEYKKKLIAEETARAAARDQARKNIVIK